MKQCNYCGTPMWIDITYYYMSAPPQYLYVCPKCGKKEIEEIDIENRKYIEL